MVVDNKRSLEWKLADEKDLKNAFYEDHRQRLQKLGYGIPTPHQIFSLLIDYQKGELDPKLEKVAKTFMAYGAYDFGFFSNMAFRRTGPKLTFYEYAHSLQWDKSLEEYYTVSETTWFLAAHQFILDGLDWKGDLTHLHFMNQYNPGLVDFLFQKPLEALPAAWKEPVSAKDSMMFLVPQQSGLNVLGVWYHGEQRRSTKGYEVEGFWSIEPHVVGKVQGVRSFRVDR